MAAEKTANGNGAAKVEKTPEELFEASVNTVGKKAKEIATRVREWKSGESELRELLMQVELGQIQFNRAFSKMVEAHKNLRSQG